MKNVTPVSRTEVFALEREKHRTARETLRRFNGQSRFERHVRSVLFTRMNIARGKMLAAKKNRIPPEERGRYWPGLN